MTVPVILIRPKWALGTHYQYVGPVLTGLSTSGAVVGQNLVYRCWIESIRPRIPSNYTKLSVFRVSSPQRDTASRASHVLETIHGPCRPPTQKPSGPCRPLTQNPPNRRARGARCTILRRRRQGLRRTPCVPKRVVAQQTGHVAIATPAPTQTPAAPLPFNHFACLLHALSTMRNARAVPHVSPYGCFQVCRPPPPDATPHQAASFAHSVTLDHPGASHAPHSAGPKARCFSMLVSSAMVSHRHHQTTLSSISASHFLLAA